MIKIGYNIDLKTLRNRYLKIFELQEMKRIWQPFEVLFGINLEDLLTADFEKLVDLYYQYKTKALTVEQVNTLEDLFNYERYQPKLAWFFMNPENKFNFSTCHYCNTAYINAYGKGDTFENVLHFVNNATKAEWRYWFTEKELSEDSIKKILNEQPYPNLSEFNGKKYLGKKIELYKRMMFVPKENQVSPDSNQFDLDHVLPKALCPLTSLSLFNFVPSCQVCNEKLKKDSELAGTKSDWLKISPTSSNNRFDIDVTIKLVPEKSCSTFFELIQNRENYRLDFVSPSDVYDKYVTIFRLHDRYNYHKQLALHILDLKERYSEEKIKEISKMLSVEYDDTGLKYSEEQVREDIFRMGFSKNRCFFKLRKDMMERN